MQIENRKHRVQIANAESDEKGIFLFILLGSLVTVQHGSERWKCNIIRKEDKSLLASLLPQQQQTEQILKKAPLQKNNDV